MRNSWNKFRRSWNSNPGHDRPSGGRHSFLAFFLGSSPEYSGPEDGRPRSRWSFMRRSQASSDTLPNMTRQQSWNWWPFGKSTSIDWGARPPPDDEDRRLLRVDPPSQAPQQTLVDRQPASSLPLARSQAGNSGSLGAAPADGDSWLGLGWVSDWLGPGPEAEQGYAQWGRQSLSYVQQRLSFAAGGYGFQQFMQDDGKDSFVRSPREALPASEEPWWQKPFWRKIIGGFLIWIVVTVAFLPREPKWEVLDLQVDDVNIPALTGLSGMYSSLTSNSSAIRMTLSARARASNPNFIGANALPGVFDIQYKSATIGRAASREQAIGPMSSVEMIVQVKVDSVPTAMGLQMVREMQEHNMQLPIMVKGGVVAEVWKLRVLTTILCDLKCDVSRLPEKTTFTKKVCTYTYGPP